MDDHRIVALGPDTWSAFEGLAGRHNGVSGGCWCTWFHTMHGEKTFDAGDNRALKERLVRTGRAHAALVMEGDEAVAWAQYGPPAELPNIYHRREVEAAGDPLPDWRITCVFVDKRRRRSGLAAVALRGAVELIATSGGGVVEGYPHDTDGARISNLYDGTRTMFEAAGFRWIRAKGQRNCVMRAEVASRPAG